MLLATTFLALFGLAAAAPTDLEARAGGKPITLCPIDTNPITGAYIDGGCGTTITPVPFTGAKSWCVQTNKATALRDPVFLGECTSGSITGGRWEMTTSLYLDSGWTAIRNMQADTPDWCMTYNTDFTVLYMARCTGQTNQKFTSDGKHIKVYQRNYCLAAIGLKSNAFDPKVPSKSGRTDLVHLTLTPCMYGRPTQRFAMSALPIRPA